VIRVQIRAEWRLDRSHASRKGIRRRDRRTESTLSRIRLGDAASNKGRASFQQPPRAAIRAVHRNSSRSASRRRALPARVLTKFRGSVSHLKRTSRLNCEAIRLRGAVKFGRMLESASRRVFRAMTGLSLPCFVPNNACVR